MNPKRNSSVYARAKKHTITLIIAMPIIAWGIPTVMLEVLEFSWNTTMLVVIPVMFAWVIIGGGRGFFIVCPNCHKSLFMRGRMFNTPFPEKQCSKCGTDLTRAKAEA